MSVEAVKVRRLRIWILWVLAVVAAVCIAVLITDVRMTDAQRDGCERRQDIFRTVADSLDTAAANSESKREAEEYRKQSAQIRTDIVDDCNEAYPHIIPFVE